MHTAVVVFVAALMASAVLTRVVRGLAVQVGAVDYALVSRKIHRRPTPRLGGVAIVAAFYLPVVAVLFFTDAGAALRGEGHRDLGLLAGGLAIAALGIYDDVRGVGARGKFAFQIAVAALMYGCGYQIDHIASPFAPTIDLGVLGAPFTVLWIVGVINAVNLIDGLDGLAGGVAFIAAVTTLILALIGGEALTALAAAALAGATLGFLFYNFNPASIFMGDTGSMFLGLVLATAAIPANQVESQAVAVVVPAIALGLPITDTLLAMTRRAVRGVPMFRGDRGHIHHRLLDRGLTHRQAVLVLYAASVAFGLTALLVAYARPSVAMWFLLALGGVGYVMLRKLGFIDLDAARDLMEQRRRNVLVGVVMRRAGEAIRFASTPEDLWKQVRRAARMLGATCVAFGFGTGEDDAIAFSHGVEDAPLDLLSARYALTPERPGPNYIEFGWSDGRTTIDRDTEIAIELLCHHLAPAVERLDEERRWRKAREREQGYGNVVRLGRR